MGAALVSGGPFVTDVRVNIGDGGATTTYQMQLAPRFGKMARANSERFTKLAKREQRLRRSIRQINRTLSPNSLFFKIRSGALDSIGAKVAFRRANASSHMMLQGECLPTSGDTYHINMCLQPGYNEMDQTMNEYSRKGIMSLDGLIVPFSTDTGASGIPHYRAVSGDSSTITRNSLDPFVTNHGITQIAKNYSLSDDDTLHEMDGYGSVYRGAALRGPVTIAGWGYDAAGNPVPSGTDGLILANIRQKPDQWKVGPLDVRWNDTKQLWSASSLGVFPATAKQNVLPDSNNYSFQLTTGEFVSAWNYLQQPVCSGSKAVLGQGGPTGYFLISSLYNATTVVTTITCVSGVQTITYNTIYTPAAIGINS